MHCPHCNTWYCLIKPGTKEAILTESRLSIVVGDYRYRITQRIEENKTIVSKLRHPVFPKSKWKIILTLNHLKFFSPYEAEYLIKNKLKLYTVFS